MRLVEDSTLKGNSHIAYVFFIYMDMAYVYVHVFVCTCVLASCKYLCTCMWRPEAIGVFFNHIPRF